MEDQEQVAPETQTNEGAQAPEVTSPAPGASEVTNTQQDVQRVPAQEASPAEQVSVNWQEKYQKTLAKLGVESEEELENHRHLRKKFVEQGTEKNLFKSKFESLEKRQDEILKALAKATGQDPDDPAKFAEDLNARGYKAIEERIANLLADKEKATNARFEEMQYAMRAKDVSGAVKEAVLDTKSYPGFEALIPTMMAQLEDLREEYKVAQLDGNKNVVDPDACDPYEVVNYLYKQSKLKHSEQAILKAKELGAKQKEEELAREASTAVAGGGKITAQRAKDLSGMSTEDMEKAFGWKV